MKTGKETGKLNWQYRLQENGRKETTKNRKKSRMDSTVKRGKRPTALDIIGKVWPGLIISEEEATKSNNPGGFQEELPGAVAVREGQGLKNELHVRKAWEYTKDWIKG